MHEWRLSENISVQSKGEVDETDAHMEKKKKLQPSIVQNTTSSLTSFALPILALEETNLLARPAAIQITMLG